MTPDASTLPTLSPSQITALDTYVATPDPSYQFSLNSTIVGPGYTDYVINLISQTWNPQPGVSEVWQHWLQIIVPSTVDTTTAVLNIGSNANTPDPPTSPDPLSLQAALALNAVVTFIPSVPNEPVTFPSLGETTPLSEDDLVAYSFQQFLSGDGQDWPILLPMVKRRCARHGYDAVVRFEPIERALAVQNFIVTGLPKRGGATRLSRRSIPRPRIVALRSSTALISKSRSRVSSTRTSCHGRHGQRRLDGRRAVYNGFRPARHTAGSSATEHH